MKLAAAILLLAFAIIAVTPLHHRNVCLQVDAARSLVGHHPPGEGHRSGGRGGHRRRGDAFALYVFGDSFADTGNLPRRERDDAWPALTRQWYYPYAGTGRFSNLQVQTDFIAEMLGHTESPPAHALGGGHAGKAGVNFAVGGSGVFQVPEQLPTLRMQVDDFLSLAQAGGVDEDTSVALLAVSGNDYARVRVAADGFADLTLLVERVTAEIAAAAARLRGAGVRRVLVNNMHPLGCAPSLTRPANHTRCDALANQAASLHNSRLADRLAGVEGVLVLDLDSAFASILKHHSDGGGDLAQNFAHKLAPCCESVSPGGFCGLREERVDLYTLCDDPDEYFFWDEMNPTQAGWAAVMAQLEAPIKEFLHME